jgi:hypothetical protein
MLLEISVIFNNLILLYFLSHYLHKVITKESKTKVLKSNEIVSIIDAACEDCSYHSKVTVTVPHLSCVSDDSWREVVDECARKGYVVTRKKDVVTISIIDVETVSDEAMIANLNYIYHFHSEVVAVRYFKPIEDVKRLKVRLGFRLGPHENIESIRVDGDVTIISLRAR